MFRYLLYGEPLGSSPIRSFGRWRERELMASPPIRERAKAELERRAWMRRLKDEGKPIPAQPYFDRAMLVFSNAELQALANE